MYNVYIERYTRFNTKIDNESKMVNKLKAKLNTTAGVLLKYWTISLKLNKYNNKTKKEFSVIYKFRASLNKFRMPWKFRAPQKKKIMYTLKTTD